MEQNRELEARLEQALHRWKLEKETSTQETEKYIKMRSTCATLVEQLNQSATDAAQLADRLGECASVRIMPTLKILSILLICYDKVYDDANNLDNLDFRKLIFISHLRLQLNVNPTNPTLNLHATRFV